MTTSPDSVHQCLAKHMLADGFPLVLDLERSQGNVLVDAVSGREYVDVFSFFASGALGHNHPVFDRPEVQRELLAAAKIKPSLADIYTQTFADFVQQVAQVTPASMVHHFFIEGGALAVENALKASFDWKVRKNLEAGHGEKGSQIIHFTEAFHGRSGYTLSLTNTNSKVKTQYFPMFRWPRVPSPAKHFPCEGENLEKTIEAEEQSLEQIKQALVDNPHDVAAIIIEPIQSEGGDRHFRGEFLKALRELTLEEDILLIFDEVQTGLGLTGRWWCHQHFDVTPDILVFGKKMQVGGIAATNRLDDVESVFKVSSRINSTFGGNFTDMVRARWILQTIEDDNLVANAQNQGEKFLNDLQQWSSAYPDDIFNLRGLGLLIAFDLADAQARDLFIQKAWDRGLFLLPCGARTIRFRPFLIFDDVTEQKVMDLLKEVMVDLKS